MALPDAADLWVQNPTDFAERFVCFLRVVALTSVDAGVFKAGSDASAAVGAHGHRVRACEGGLPGVLPGWFGGAGTVEGRSRQRMDFRV